MHDLGKRSRGVFTDAGEIIYKERSSPTLDRFLLSLWLRAVAVKGGSSLTLGFFGGAMTIENLKKCVSGLALSIALIHVLFPDLGIDFIAVTLIAIAVVPWLVPLIKSVELPGGIKFELQDLERAEERAEKAGLLSKMEETDPEAQYSFQIVADTDPNLALAGLRIEIEKRLVQLAELFGIGTKKQGVGRLMFELTKAEALTNEERSVLSDLVELLNAAVHGEKWNDSAAQWALETGPRLLRSLDERLRLATERVNQTGNPISAMESDI